MIFHMLGKHYIRGKNDKMRDLSLRFEFPFCHSRAVWILASHFLLGLIFSYTVSPAHPRFHIWVQRAGCEGLQHLQSLVSGAGGWGLGVVLGCILSFLLHGVHFTISLPSLKRQKAEQDPWREKTTEDDEVAVGRLKPTERRDGAALPFRNDPWWYKM